MAKKTKRTVKKKPITTGRVGTAHQGTKKATKTVSKWVRSHKNDKAAPKLEKLAAGVVAMAQRKADPAIAIPVRYPAFLTSNRHVKSWDVDSYATIVAYARKNFLDRRLAKRSIC